jgi:hypothetical protein
MKYKEMQRDGNWSTIDRGKLMKGKLGDWNYFDKYKYLLQRDRSSNFTEQSPWKTRSFSAGRGIIRLLWNQRGYCRIDKSPSLIRILN